MLAANEKAAMFPQNRHPYSAPAPVDLTNHGDQLRVTTLPNGLRVVSENMPHLATVAVGVWFNVGTRNEPIEKNGVAHLLEHMLFKGTSRRTAQQISEAIENVGGHSNAYTARDVTAYYLRLLHQDLPLGIDVLADMLQHSVFDPLELAREQQVIIQEIGQAEDTPDDIIFDHLQQAAYGPVPMGLPILGQPDVIAALQSADVAAYAQNVYTANQAVLAVAGRVDHDALVDLAARHFARLPNHPPAPPVPGAFLGQPILLPRNLEQTHVALALPAVGNLHPDYFAYSVYTTLLGGSSASRLFLEVREKHGLAYSIHSFLSNVDDSGLMIVYAGTGHDAVPKLADLIRAEILATAQHITPVELARAKQQLKAGMLMGLEQPFARAEQMAQHLLTYGRVLGIEEMMQKIDAVTAADIQSLVQTMIATKPALAALGPEQSIACWQQMSL